MRPSPQGTRPRRHTCLRISAAVSTHNLNLLHGFTMSFFASIFLSFSFALHSLVLYWLMSLVFLWFFDFVSA